MIADIFFRYCLPEWLGYYLCPPKLPPERDEPPPKLPLEPREPPNERLGAENERVGADWLGAENERLGAENVRLGVERSKLPRFMLRVEPPKKLLPCGRVTVVRVLL